MMYQSKKSTTTIQLDEYDYGKSRKVSLLSSIKSSFGMNLRLYWRYKINLISGLIEFIVLMFVFSIFAMALYYKNGYEYLTQADIVIFYMGAILIMAFNSTALWTPVSNVNRDIYNGTIEYLFSTPGSKYGYFVGSVLADGFIKFIVLFLPMFTILAFASGIFNQPDALAGVMVVSLIVLINLISLGILISLLAIVWKQINSIAGMINTLFQFLAGAFFPITTFPQPLQLIAYLMPQTFGYDLVRYFSFHGKWVTIFPVELEIIILVFFTVIYFLLSIFLLKKTERFAKKTGLNRI